MQTHGSDKRPEAGIGDGGRDAERRTLESALRLACALLSNLAHGAVRVAEPGKPVNLSAKLTGSGGASA